MTGAAEPFSDEQTRAVEKLVRDYIINNPEIVVESLRGYEEKHRQASEKEARRPSLPVVTSWKRTRRRRWSATRKEM